jgi:hypothetical protein
MKCSGLLRDMNHGMPEGSNLFCHRRNHSRVTGGAGLADGVWRVGVRRWVGRKRRGQVGGRIYRIILCHKGVKFWLFPFEFLQGCLVPRNLM